MAINIRKNNQLSQMSALMSNKSIKSIYVKIGNESKCVWGMDMFPFTYTEDENGVEITGLKQDVQIKNLIIPEKIGEKKVYSIKSDAFKNNTFIENVFIPDTVEKIGLAAFKGCTSINTIRIPFVGETATAEGPNQVFGFIFGYQRTNSVSTVNGAINQYSQYENLISGNQKMLYWYFIPTSIKNITIGKASQTISSSAFARLSGLDCIDIGDAVETIDTLAFYACEADTVIIGKKVKSIRGGIHNGICNLILNAEDLSNFTNIEKGVFTKCTTLKTVTVGVSVKKMHSKLFYYGQSIETINWNAQNCKNVAGSDNLFGSCTKAKLINIGQDVEYLDHDLFAGRSTLSTIATVITFAGTMSQWEALINKSSPYWDRSIEYSVIHCTDGDIPKQ